ncbi:MAG: hypothetical protein Athens071424_117 [Parcubacteria group bacterium Athens0714_24]|nr:MAG: hypothetical protein Athens071424_117 [Parcubacteria group bacterium Athens0714_24]
MYNNHRKVLALIDYENITKCSVEKGQIVDFKALRNFLKNIGEIMFAFIFLPDHYVYSLPDDLNNLGYQIVLCQRLKGQERDKDMVDSQLNLTGSIFCQFSEITDIVIVSNDADMVRLAGLAEMRGKRIHVVGTDKLSSVYKKVVDVENIHELPLKK